MIVNKNIGYIPSLDGLRAIAIILVLLTHANFQLGKNGILGVDMFFCLSGFLITRLLLEEYSKHQKISFSAFFVRRVYRLLPALFILLVVIFVYSIFFTEGLERSSISEEILATTFYFYNISWIWGLGSKSSILSHCWSLAVEEQFYLVWPVILVFVIKFGNIKKMSWLILAYGLFNFL